MQKGQQNQKKLDQKLIWYFGCLRDPQTHPGAKMTPKMACESQIWPRCTPRGITSLFRTKELIFETDRSKLSHFTRNYPPLVPSSTFRCHRVPPGTNGYIRVLTFTLWHCTHSYHPVLLGVVLWSNWAVDVVGGAGQFSSIWDFSALCIISGG